MTRYDEFILLVDPGGGGQVDEEVKLLEEFVLLLDAEEFVLLIDVDEEGKLLNSFSTSMILPFAL